MGNDQFMDGLPIKNDDFPFFHGYVTGVGKCPILGILDITL